MRRFLTKIKNILSSLNGKKSFTFGLFFMVVVGLVLPPVQSIYSATGSPKMIHHQGRLLDSSGNLLGGSSGTDYCFRFSLWDVASGGSANPNQLWPSSFATPSTMTVNVKNGVLNTRVGDVSAGGDLLDFDFNSTDTVYLHIDVAAQVASSCAGVSFESLTPYQRISAAPYALNSNTVGGFTPSQSPTANQVPVLNGSGNLNLAGSVQSGGLSLGTASSVTGAMILNNSTNSNTVTIQPGVTASSYTLTLPTTAGTANQFLQTNGSGVLSWTTIGGGGDALVANPLSQFAATTSAQLAGVISDETGTGGLVFATAPTFDTTVTLTTSPTASAGGYEVLTRNTTSGVIEKVSSGTFLTGNQTVTLTGDVTGSGATGITTTIGADAVALGTDTTGNYVATIADAGSGRITVANSGSENAGVTLDIADDAVTFAKIQNITDARLIGRSAGSAGDAQEISVGTGLSLAGGTLTSTITQYTNEDAQDAVGGALTSEFTYNDGANSIALNSINWSKIASTPTTFSGYGISDTSANLDTAITDDTGSGALVFGTSPTIGTATLNNPSIDKISNLTSNGFIRTSGGDGTLSIDTNTYLTAETDTLSSVTGRGATTSTASSFTGGASIRGLTIENATSTDDQVVLSITSGGSAARFVGTITNSDLTAARTYTLPNATGTFITTGNISDISGLTDSQISDTLTASVFKGSGTTTDAIDLATAEVAGTLPVGNGGTGATTLTGLLLGNGTSAVTAVTTSSGISGAISDETGSGALVFGTAPTFATTVTLTTSPTASAGGYEILTRNTGTGVIEKVTSGTFLTTEADTLSSVTGRGATTSTASSFTGGATVRGLTVDNATANSDSLAMTVTAAGANAFTGTITNADLTAARTYTLPNASITFNAAADISGTTLASNVVTSSLTTVGALNAGSITSGFGSIDTGSDTITTSGAVSGGTINGLTITANGTNTLNIAAGSTLATSGANSITLTSTGATNVTLPTSGTLVSSVTTGNGVSASNTAGALAFTLGAITPTTVNGITFSGASTPTLAVTGTSSISGTNTGDQTSVTGNAGTVTFADAGGDTTTFIALGTDATGSLSPATDAGLTYNATTNAVTATTFIGALTGNVTGDVSGNAGTATALASNPTDCGANTFATTIAANGNLTCASIADADVPNNITVDLATLASAVTNATLTTALTVNTGTVTISGNAANNSVLTLGAGASSISGSNTGDQTITLTGDVTGSGTGSFAATIASDSVALGTDTTGNYVASITAGGGLTGTAASEGSTPTIAVVSGNGAIVANADDITLTLASAANGLSSTTSSGSGMEVLSSGLALLQGCSDTQILKWNESTDTWDCAADVSGGGGGATTALDNLTGVAINTSLVSDTDNTDALGSATIGWSDLFLGNGAVINFNNGNFTATHSSGALAFSGSISASNLSGSNTGDQTITLSGDVSGSGTSGITATIGNDKITEAMLKAVNGATDEYCLTKEDTTGDFEWQACVGSEADTLASVTGRGATTSTASSFTGGATVRGLTVDNATANSDSLAMTVTAAGANAFTGTITNADLTAARTYTLPNASITFNAAADISGTTLASNVVTSSLTTVGALNAGSITSGFGAIDLGADNFTTTGVVNTDTLTLTNIGTLNGLDAIDATTETTLEGAIDIAGDVDGTGLTGVDLDEVAVETELESVLDLSDLQGAVTDAQVPNNITVDLATLATTVTVTDSTDATSFIAMYDSATGSLDPRTDGALTYNASTGALATTGTISASNLSGSNTGDQTITLTGDVTGSGTGSFAATIASDAVTFAKIQNITDARLIGRSAGSAGDAQEISVGTGLSLSAGVLSSSLVGVTDGDKGDIVVSSTGTVWDVDADVIDFADMEDTLDLDAALTLNQGTNTWAQTFTGTTATGLAYTANSLTSGKAIEVNSSSTAFTGNLANFTLSGSNAANTGAVVQIDNTGVANTNTGLLVNHYATGTGNLALRVNDVSGDTTPFVIDGTGAVGIGTNTPAATKLDVISSAGGVLQVLRSSSTSTSAILHLEATDGTDTPRIVGVKAGTNGQLILQTGSNDVNHITEGSDRLTILSTGNVGIGDATPASLFTVGASDAFQVNSSGALVAGSITSGFGSIDLGADNFTTTGVVNTDTLTLTNIGTLNGLDAIDATTETTLEGAIDIAGDVTGTGLGSVTIAADAVALGTDTTGNYILDIVAGAGLTGDTAGEGATATLAIGAGTGITVNANDVAITADGIGDTQLTFNTGQHLTTTSSVAFNDVTLTNTGLHLLDTNATHDLIIAPGSNLTADRTFTVTTGDTDRTLTLTGDATISGTNTGDQTSVTGNAGTVTFADAGGDTTTFIALGTDATGSLSPATDAGLTYNATTNAVTATTFIGALTGNVTGDVSGNAGTATALASNPTDCAANTFATTIAANGNLTCASILDADVPNNITVDLATLASAVTNATLTTALTVNTGTVTISGNAANNSVLTLGAGASSISGSNTGDQTITLTGDVTGSGTGSFAATIASDSVALGTDTTGNYVASITAGGGLTGTAASEGSTPTIAVVSGNGGIIVNADDITLTVAPSSNALSSTTSSGSGMEVLSSGVALLQGCSDTQILKWNESTDTWDCAADAGGGLSDADYGDIVISSSGTVMSIDADVVDFADMIDSMTIDAVTDINLGANAFTIDMDSTGDFSIRDGSTDIATFTDAGAITFAPTSGQNLTATLAGAGIFNVSSGQSLLGGTALTTGTQAKLNIVSTVSTSGSTTAIAGIHGEYTTSNGGASSYVQVGNRFVMNNAPTTNSNTAVNTVIRSVDNTALSNLVRGIEVVSNAGSNIAGENTGIRTTGATFGLQAFTNASANASAVPAAIFAESTGTTSGDVLRLYSISATSAPSFATFYHKTSTFTGTGLLMDFAEGAGSFTGNFIDLQNNNTSKFTVDDNGALGIADATPDYMLDVNADVADYTANIFNDGNATTRSGLLIQAGLDDHTAAGPSTLIGFKDGDGTTVGSITFGSSATAYNTTSDQRLKENVVDTSLSLDTLNQIKIHDYTWIADSQHKISHGVLAQELFQVYPGAVTVPTDESTSYWMVDYSKLTPLTIKSIQDLSADLETQKTRIQGISLVNNVTTFSGDISFGGAVEFNVPPMFNNDTAGFAVIKTGSNKVDVVFDNPYIAQPVVGATISLEDSDAENMTDEQASAFFAEDIKSLVTNKTQNGFTIRINKNATRDIKFSWTALQVKDVKTFESIIPGLTIDPVDPPVTPNDPPTDPVGSSSDPVDPSTNSVDPAIDPVVSPTTDPADPIIDPVTDPVVDPAPTDPVAPSSDPVTDPVVDPAPVE